MTAAQLEKELDKYNLGRLERIDLRSVWKHEAHDFTQWLGNPKNIEVLGNVIGLELEVDRVEKPIGRFNADIFCKVVGDTDHVVLIENQLERTDHSHLGQLLTYAAGLEVVTLIWVAERFTDEHRGALDWLNEITAEKINFFGIEVELLKIGNSNPAPNFKIISQPNDWTKIASRSQRVTGTGEASQAKLQQLEYWAGLAEYIKQNNIPLKSQKPQAQSWTVFALGKTTIFLAASVNGRDEWIAVGVTMQGPNAKSYYANFLSQKEAIEKELGPVEWQELPGIKESRIRVRMQNVNYADTGEWQKQHKWICDNLVKFNRVFRPLVAKISD